MLSVPLDFLSSFSVLVHRNCSVALTTKFLFLIPSICCCCCKKHQLDHILCAEAFTLIEIWCKATENIKAFMNLGKNVTKLSASDKLKKNVFNVGYYFKGAILHTT